MPKLTLYHFPGACSQVTVCALEQTGLPYETCLVNLALGEQTQAEYKSVNPLKKVPALLIDGFLLTENAAILYYLSELAPAAGILPQSQSSIEKAEQIGGMSFCGATLHPLVRGILNPGRITDGDGSAVRSRSLAVAETPFGYAEKRLQQRGWWLGQRSIVDVYLNWTCSIARNGGFDFQNYRALTALPERLADWPAFARMQEMEINAMKQLRL